eukprot:g2096.t1
MGACFSRSCCLSSQKQTAANFSLPANFTVIKELGYGNEGKTFLIQERRLDGNHLYACKILPRGIGISPEFILKGLRNQSCLRFVNVVQFLEVLLTKTHLIIKFEYVNGGDLFEYLCRQRNCSKNQLLTEEHARYLFNQILFGLHHCHENRVAHRDITLTNTLCTKRRNPVIKICDFGLSKSWASPQDAQSFSAVGTVWFMSPEVISRFNQGSDKPYDPRKADIWSLGVILYVMLLGRFPFLSVDSNDDGAASHLMAGSSASLSFLMRNIERALQLDPQRVTTEIDSMKFLSSEVQELLKSMLTLEADERIDLDKLMEHQWVRGPFDLSRGRSFSGIYFHEGSGEVRDGVAAPHAELVPGSPADEELRSIVESATHPGTDEETLVRWCAPSVRLDHELTRVELAALESEGIRQCRTCSSTSDTAPYAAWGLPIIHY